MRVAIMAGVALAFRFAEERDVLVAWYERRGYRRTGESKPFPYGNARFGKPKRPDLSFVVLSKPLAGLKLG